MNIAELREAISFLFQPNAILGFELYLVLKSDQETVLRRADLGDGNLPTDVRNGFLRYINERTNENEEVIVRPLSELDSSKNTIHHYDMDGLPIGLEVINTPLVTEEIPIFNFNNDKLDDIEAFLVYISSVDQNVVLYKRHYHLNLLKQSKIFYFIKDNERFSKPEEAILRFSFTHDFLKVGEEIIVYNINCLEKNFQFSDILINNAQKKIDQIAVLDLVENINELQEFAQQTSGARKVLKIRPDSPVLALQFNQIKTFVKNHPYLRSRLRFNDDESMFRFHTQASKGYFIDLLNDNFLTSDLTSIYYKSNTKDKMKTEGGEEEDQ